MSGQFPAVPTDALADGGWRERERRETRAFDAKVVAVDAATLVFEDVALRERLRAATGLDGLWRFFVASRLTLTPRTPPSPSLTKLVANRGHAGFADTLADRGFEGVRRANDDGRAAAAAAFDDDVRLAAYDALCRLDEVAVRARGWAGVVPHDGAYLLVGGAYPTAVREAPDAATADAVAAALDAEGFREELFALMRDTG